MLCGVDPGLSPWGNTKGEVGDVSDCVGTFGSSVPKGLCAMAMIDRVPHLLGYPIGMRICGPHIELTLTRCMGSGITLRLTCITVSRPVLFIFARSIARPRAYSPLAGLACGRRRRAPRLAARRRLRPLRRLPAGCGREWLAEWSVVLEWGTAVGLLSGRACTGPG